MKARDLISDTRFIRGLQLLDNQSSHRAVVDQLVYDKANGAPVWLLAQWGSKFSLAKADAVAVGPGSIQYANKAKAVTLSSNAEVGDLVLAVHGPVEYADTGRARHEPWVHLLVEQDIPPDVAPALPNMTELRFHLSYRLNYSMHHRPSNYDARYQAAQFLVHLIVQNQNTASAGYGDFFWFGIPLYDDRYTYSEPYKAQDFAVTGGKFIFNAGTRAFTADSSHSGEWVTIDRDILPLVVEGLETAWARNYLQQSRNISDYRIANMNMGWEVPGVFDVEMAVKDLSVRGH